VGDGLIQVFRVGVYSLMLHKMRSGLAILGILIGIVAVIWLVALGEGASFQAQERIKDLGATNVIVKSKKPVQQATAGRAAFFLEYGLLRADVERILTNVPDVTKIVPFREIKREVRSTKHKFESRVVGCTPEFRTLNRLTLQRGRFITDRDGDPPTNVVVLGAKTALELFKYEDPIGQAIQIDNDFYRVVGVTAERDPTAAIGGSMESQDYNYDVYIPLETLRWRIGDMVATSRSGSREGEIVQLNQITIGVADFSRVDDTADIIRTLMDKYHPMGDVDIVVPKELLRQAELLRMLFNFLLVLIAGISLAVGGIGIMNIMLATVTERTREIGIRRALGAKRRDIIRQFLVESVVLTGVGGSLGVLLGFTVGPGFAFMRWLGTQIFPDHMSALPAELSELRPMIAPWSIFVSLCISIVVGVFFGFYPAYRAAHMDPIEALRHE
jgi:putative ABC transport system permease protein